MASLRRVKVLLVLNLIAVAGFVLFLAKCRPITTKSGDSYHDIHPRAEVANLTAHGISSIQDAVLKRLSLLEDIVYRQLNGLSKSLGLIEGYGGRGKGGLPATLSPEEEEKAKGPHEKYGYNSYLSEKISLDRSIPDYRPTKCKELKYGKDLPQISIIFIFVNEALSVILRSVHSAVNHTPECHGWCDWREEQGREQGVERSFPEGDESSACEERSWCTVSCSGCKHRHSNTTGMSTTES
uniref:Polypeptide N-acetylgalactosaminyltransferase 17 n=1 Tax=Junco hyemalis TaxID=40217 RepID=A0A8C5IGZ8_JUNHY